MTPADSCILIVEDEALIALALSDVVEGLGLRVCGTAATALRAIQLAEQHRPMLVLMDVRLKGKEDGVFAAQEIHRQHLAPVVFITGSREQETIDRINQDHPAEVLFKPIIPQQLEASIRKLMGGATGGGAAGGPA